MDSLPWWTCALFAYALVYGPLLDDRAIRTFLPSGDANSLEVKGSTGSLRGIAEKAGNEAVVRHDMFSEVRQLSDAAPPPPIMVVGENMYVQVPCWLPVKPCGNVSVPPEGVDIKGAFGLVHYHVPGFNSVKPEYEQVKNAFSQYTVYFVVIVGALWALSQVCSSTKRAEWWDAWEDVKKGELDEKEDDQTPEDAEKELKKKLDPESEDFIAPGNIYRLLAVMHPGIIGYRKWGHFAFKAGICAYMQLYIPYKIGKNVFVHWSFHGVKSPIWFAENAPTFATMFAALASMCNLFSNECSVQIISGAEANFYILSHQRPYGSEPAAAVEAANGDYRSLIRRPQLPEWAISWNEKFWCTLSMFMNISMSLIVQGVFFLKMATFTNEIISATTVAISLYFIFDLDDKVMKSDPTLRPKYRREVLKQTEEREYKPIYIKQMAALFICISKLMVPLGMFGIILIAWQSNDNGYIIGGSGLNGGSIAPPAK